MGLKEIRQQQGLTQEEAAKFLGITRRTYANYESGKIDQSSLKYKYIINALQKANLIDEEHGILTIEKIKEICAEVFQNYDVEYCYLFGSYAKGMATETSDVDLLVSVSSNGMKFFGLVETLREQLRKKVDVLDMAQLNNNMALVQEILKDGIKIYG